MFKRILLCIFLVLILLSQYLNNISNISYSIKNHKNINVLVAIKGFDNLNQNTLKLVLFQYCHKTKSLKVLCINDKITILQKKKKSQTLNEMFFSQKEDEQVDFIKKEIELLLDNKLKINYYVLSNTKTLQLFVKLFDEKKIIKQLGNNYFEQFVNNKEYILSIIYMIKIIKYVIANTNRYILVDFIKFLDAGNYLITNFKLSDCFFLYSKIKNIDMNTIQFADIPTINKRNRIELEPAGLMEIIEFLNEDKDISHLAQNQNDKVKIEVINASSKNRLASKAVDKLRKNKFDIYEWGVTSYKIHEYTIIFDLINSYEQSVKVKNILNSGEIIFRPIEKSFVDISVLLGKDCTIYDKLDKIDKSY